MERSHHHMFLIFMGVFLFSGALTLSCHQKQKKARRMPQVDLGELFTRENYKECILVQSNKNGRIPDHT